MVAWWEVQMRMRFHFEFFSKFLPKDVFPCHSCSSFPLKGFLSLKLIWDNTIVKMTIQINFNWIHHGAQNLKSVSNSPKPNKHTVCVQNELAHKLQIFIYFYFNFNSNIFTCYDVCILQWVQFTAKYTRHSKWKYLNYSKII